METCSHTRPFIRLGTPWDELLVAIQTSDYIQRQSGQRHLFWWKRKIWNDQTQTCRGNSVCRGTSQNHFRHEHLFSVPSSLSTNGSLLCCAGSGSLQMNRTAMNDKIQYNWNKTKIFHKQVNHWLFYRFWMKLTCISYYHFKQEINFCSLNPKHFPDRLQLAAHLNKSR